MTKRLFQLTTLLFAFSLCALAADITGKWVAQVPGRGGQTMEQVFTFKQTGTTFTGTRSGFQGAPDPAISEGKIEGDNISFTVKVEFNGNAFEQKYTGSIAGNVIKMKTEGRRGTQEFEAKKQ